jgi:nucleotide-binding universal stress UspA family protein
VGLFQRILVAFDGSPGGWAALRHGIALASRATATLWALSVEELRPPGRSPEGGGSTAAAFLARLHDEARREAARHGVALSADVARGHAARAIVDHAQRMGADLVVLGHRGHAGVVEGVLGSTADRVVDAADCSVLVVREKGDGGGSP